MQGILNRLRINESFTKPISKNLIVNNSVKENIPQKKGYNYMADLLSLPATRQRYKYLLVIVDLATDEFDIEPLKNKTSGFTLAAMEAIFNRRYVKKPYASMRTDGGAEFKGEFKQYLYDNGIIHKPSEPARHKQTANVERLNKELGRLFNGYMNMKEEQTGRPYREWIDIIHEVRRELNGIRKKDLGDPFTHKFKTSTTSKKPKYKIGDRVYTVSEYPRNALNKKQESLKFRVGDYRWNRTPVNIVKVLPYPKAFRYLVADRPHVSYAEYELRLV